MTDHRKDKGIEYHAECAMEIINWLSNADGLKEMIEQHTWPELIVAFNTFITQLIHAQIENDQRKELKEFRQTI